VKNVPKFGDENLSEKFARPKRRFVKSIPWSSFGSQRDGGRRRGSDTAAGSATAGDAGLGAVMTGAAGAGAVIVAGAALVVGSGGNPPAEITVGLAKVTTGSLGPMIFRTGGLAGGAKTIRS
jgi:hypothetical protein